MKKKNITIEDLARMVQKGFNETAKRKEVDRHFSEIDKHFDRVDRRFNGVDKRLDRIEKLLIVNHRERIERLEMEVKNLKELLAIK